MDVVISLLVLVVSFAGAILGNMIASELYDRLPAVAKWVLNGAIARLPENLRDRYREEWLADLEEWTGNLTKLWRAFGYVRAVCLLRAKGLKGPKEKIVISFLPGGGVTIELEGVKGPRCIELTKSLEDALGGRARRTLKAEFYESESLD